MYQYVYKNVCEPLSLINNQRKWFSFRDVNNNKWLSLGKVEHGGMS